MSNEMMRCVPARDDGEALVSQVKPAIPQSVVKISLEMRNYTSAKRAFKNKKKKYTSINIFT